MIALMMMASPETQKESVMIGMRSASRSLLLLVDGEKDRLTVCIYAKVPDAGLRVR